NKESLKMKDFHKELGYSFEKPYLFEKKTVYQNLTYYSKLYQKSLNIDSFLKSVNYSKFRNTPIKNLSNSSKIFVNILRSMISEPKLMIFDNLFEDMFLDERELIFDFLLKNARNRSTIVLLDRHMFFPLKIADRITFVVNNEIHKITSTATLKSKYQNQQVTITYEKNNSLYEECFSKSIFREDTFLQFLKEVSIQEITTKNIIDDELYKLETGVDLNE
ncbi:MAG: ATP-binding cassette domain-containing protein, partial [Firmicutes bacterium]|nr:ATP-binding cassette domain-containing protein [Bacillota bacterium]